VRSPDELATLGNRIEALESVPTAIASFGLAPESFEETIANVIFLGGDTDTLAAMAGAVAGAYLIGLRIGRRSSPRCASREVIDRRGRPRPSRSGAPTRSLRVCALRRVASSTDCPAR